MHVRARDELRAGVTWPEALKRKVSGAWGGPADIALLSTKTYGRAGRGASGELREVEMERTEPERISRGGLRRRAGAPFAPCMSAACGSKQ